MKPIEVQKGMVSVQLNRNELLLLNNALNDICNGIDLRDEVSTRIGCVLPEA